MFSSIHTQVYPVKVAAEGYVTQTDIALETTGKYLLLVPNEESEPKAC